jgi:FKBP-type peptidyl-prolyl cis-trans isomerase FklB
MMLYTHLATTKVNTMRSMIFAAMAVALMAAPALAQPAPGYDTSPASNKKFLADNLHKAGVKTFPSGLQYRVLTAGHGIPVRSTMDKVFVNYKGWLINGKMFDASQPGHPAHFQVSGLIRGWVEALQHMREGDSWELVIPAGLAYGADGAGNGLIPPNQVLVFDMEIKEVQPAAP